MAFPSRQSIYDGPHEGEGPLIDGATLRPRVDLDRAEGKPQTFLPEGLIQNSRPECRQGSGTSGQSGSEVQRRLLTKLIPSVEPPGLANGVLLGQEPRDVLPDLGPRFGCPRKAQRVSKRNGEL